MNTLIDGAGYGVWLGLSIFTAFAVWTAVVWRCRSVRVLNSMAAAAALVALLAALWSATSLVRIMLLNPPATLKTMPIKAQQSPTQQQSRH